MIAEDAVTDKAGSVLETRPQSGDGSDDFSETNTQVE